MYDNKQTVNLTTFINKSRTNFFQKFNLQSDFKTIFLFVNIIF